MQSQEWWCYRGDGEVKSFCTYCQRELAAVDLALTRVRSVSLPSVPTIGDEHWISMLGVWSSHEHGARQPCKRCKAETMSRLCCDKLDVGSKECFVLWSCPSLPRFSVLGARGLRARSLRSSGSPELCGSHGNTRNTCFACGALARIVY